MTIRAEQEITLTRVDDGKSAYVAFVEERTLHPTFTECNPQPTQAEFEADKTKYWTYDSVNEVYTQCTSASVYSSTETYYTKDSIPTEEEFNADLSDTPNKASQDSLDLVEGDVSIIQNELTDTQNNVTNLQDGLSDTQDNVNTIQSDLANELVKRGYAIIKLEGSTPALELGKWITDGTVSASEWKVRVTNEAIELSKSGVAGAKLSPNTEGGRPNETLFRTDSTRLANLYFRSADNQGSLGIVSQSNGHVSLKEI